MRGKAQSGKLYCRACMRERDRAGVSSATMVTLLLLLLLAVARSASLVLR